MNRMIMNATSCCDLVEVSDLGNKLGSNRIRGEVETQLIIGENKKK